MSDAERIIIYTEDTNYCTPCKTKDKKTKCNYYCTDCEAYYCEECFELHPRVPYLAKHIVLKHGDIDVWSTAQYKCTTHGKNLEFFCREHKLLCCHVCISLTHRSCNDMEYILESAKNVALKEDLQKMIKQTEKQLDAIKSYSDKIRRKTEVNETSKTEYIKELEAFRSRIYAMFDSLIEKEFSKMNDRFDQNTKYHDRVYGTLKRFESDLKQLKQQLTSATVGKEALLYISLKRGENLVEEITRELSQIELSTDQDNYKPVIDDEIEKYMADVEQIAFLEDEKMRRDLISSETYTENDETDELQDNIIHDEELEEDEIWFEDDPDLQE